MKTFHPWFSLHFFVSFMQKKRPIKFCGVSDHFLRTYEVEKFWMIKLYLGVSDVIYANEYIKHASCDLHENFWNFLSMPFSFIWKNIILSKSYYSGLRSSLRLCKLTSRLSLVTTKRISKYSMIYCRKFCSLKIGNWEWKIWLQFLVKEKSNICFFKVNEIKGFKRNQTGQRH